MKSSTTTRNASGCSELAKFATIPLGSGSRNAPQLGATLLHGPSVNCRFFIPRQKNFLASYSAIDLVGFH